MNGRDLRGCGASMLKRLLPAVLVLELLLPGVPSIARMSGKIGSDIVVLRAPAGSRAGVTQAQGFYIFGTNNNLHQPIGQFPYRWHTLSDPTNAGWVAGGRNAYECAWTFLKYKGELVARVTFKSGAGYTYINDKYMDERALFNDGRPIPAGFTGRPDCTPGVTAGYGPLAGGVGPLPVITFTDATDGHTLEVRNYANVEHPGDGVRFKIKSATPDRIIVVTYQAGVSVMAQYYDRLSPTVEMVSNVVGTHPDAARSRSCRRARRSGRARTARRVLGPSPEVSTDHRALLRA